MATSCDIQRHHKGHSAPTKDETTHDTKRKKRSINSFGCFVFLVAFAAVFRFRNAGRPWSTRHLRRLAVRWHDPKTVVLKGTFQERDINLESLRYVWHIEDMGCGFK